MGRLSALPANKNKSIVAAGLALPAVAAVFWFGTNWGTRDPILQGTVENDAIHVGSRIGGRVREVLVAEGALVEPGQLLVQFEDKEWIAAKAAAKSASGKLSELLPLLELSLKAQQRRSIEAPYAKALAAFEDAEKNSAPDSAARKAAKRVLDAAAEERDRLLKHGPSALMPDDLSARIRLLEMQISELGVRAPARAVVESLGVRPGDLVPPGRPIAVLLEAQRAFVIAYVSSISASALHVGQPAKVTIAGKVLDASIEHIAATAEYSPRSAIGGEDSTDVRFAVKFRTTATIGVRPGTPVQLTIPR